MAEKISYSEIFQAGEEVSSHNAQTPETVDHSTNSRQSENRSSDRSTADVDGVIPRPRAIIPGFENNRFEERKILTIRDLLYIFFKHLRSIVVITAVCLCTATLYSFSVTPQYLAETKILVKLGREGLTDLNDYSSNINILYQKRNQDVNNELEVFKGDELSRLVFEDLKEHFTIEVNDNSNTSSDSIRGLLAKIKRRFSGPALTDEDKTILFLKNSLSVEFLAETDILKLSFSSSDPVFAALAANAYADAFIKLRTKIYETTKSHRFYIDQIDIYQKKVDDLVDQEKTFSRKWQISRLETEKDLILQERKQLEAAYLESEQNNVRLSVIAKSLNNIFENTNAWIETPKMSKNEMVDRQAYLQDIDRQYFTLKLDRSRLSEKLTDKSREIQDLDVNIAKLREQKYLSLINILELSISVRQAASSGLYVELERKNKRLNELIQATFVLQRIKIEKDLVLDTLISYANKAENLRIYEDLDKNKITSLRTMNEALVPLQPYFPKKGLILLTATFFGVFLSFGMSAVKEFFTHVFRDGQDIEKVLKVPLLMSIGYRE